jgi:hypothetical protein
MRTGLTVRGKLISDSIRHFYARGFSLALTILLCASAAASALTETIQPVEDQSEGSKPAVNQTDASSEVIIEDFEKGYWFYENAADGIRIEIQRKLDEKGKVLWYEADLKFSEKSPLQFLTSNEESPGKGFSYPEVIMRRNQAVFGINDDQFGHRIYNHVMVGIIVRKGKLISNRTRRNGNLSWPTLDTAAFFSDGTMLTFNSQDYTGEEYLQMGASTVLSFGPWLVKRGVINPLCKKYFTTREPRTAIGMIEPYHFIAITVEGRVKQSRGVGMEWLAERMLALHAKEAINLDGGKTTSIIFMGKALKSNNPDGKFVKRRSVTGMITLGTSALVPPEEDLED